MNIKKKKIILNDEVKEFLDIMEKENDENKVLVKNNYEKEVNKWVIYIFNSYSFLENNFTFFDLSKSQEFITRINQLPLTKEEKLKLINYKPENIVEISVVSLYFISSFNFKLFYYL